MIANYHTHTPRCRHAVGSEREYVQAALDNGIQILGFSDHTPYPFPNGFRSPIRMLPEQLPEYAQTLQNLKKQYATQIQLHVGLEVEYYPALFSELLTAARDQGVEYLLLGQHFLGNEAGQPYAGRETSDVSILEGYCRQSMDAMQTGLFTYFAHPDLICFAGDDKTYRTHMRRLCREAKSCNLPVLSRKSAKIDFPIPRLAVIRPATTADGPGSSLPSGGSSLVLTFSISSTSGNAPPKGLIPFS